MNETAAKTPLKDLPWSPSKQQVYNLYNEISNRQLRKEMNLIIRANRNLSADEKITDHSLYHKEFVELIDLIGLPKNYKPFPDEK